jgi:cobaltochelatase CobN
MKEEGFEGANEMAKFVEYLWGWQVTVPYTVDEAKWTQVYEVYVKDKYDQKMREFFDRNNPWAYQVLVSWMLETIRKKYWDADEQTVQALSREFVRSVAEFGVACNENTCANPYLTEMVKQTVSVPGVMDPKTVQKFESVLNEATGSTLKALTEKMDQMKRNLSKKAEPVPDEAGKPESAGGEFQKIKGFEMEELDKRVQPSIDPSYRFAMVVALTVLTLFALVLYGYRSSRIGG